MRTRARREQIYCDSSAWLVLHDWAWCHSTNLHAAFGALQVHVLGKVYWQCPPTAVTAQPSPLSATRTK